VPLLTLGFGMDIRYAIGALSAGLSRNSRGIRCPDSMAKFLRLDASHPGSHGLVNYSVHAIPAGCLYLRVSRVLSSYSE
jgi:hypothetical protein